MLATRRETLSIDNEVRALAWAGVMLIATGTGIVIKNHLHDIGPLTIAIVIAIAAAGCYLSVRTRFSRAALSEYVVLLGALLVSADVAFIEHQWHLLGSDWQWHLLFLAVFHGVTAYLFDSRAVLSLSVAALASWLGVERTPRESTDWAIRAFVAAGLISIWRLANRREAFHPLFEHFAATLAFWGALMLAFGDDTRWTGAVVGSAFAAFAILYGFRKHRELFVIYGYVYGLITTDIVIVGALNDEFIIALYLLVSTIAAIVAMIVTHFRMRP